LYKAGIADRQKNTVKDWEAFSAAVLPRMFASNCQIFNKHGLPFWQLVNPVEADIDDNFFFWHGGDSHQPELLAPSKKYKKEYKKIRYLYI
jgi:hypothetical protein